MPALIRTVRHLRPFGVSAALAALLLPTLPASSPTPPGPTLRVSAVELLLTVTQVSAADQQTILGLHSQYRAAVGVAPLTWDDQLASDAQKWVDGLVQRGGKLAHANPADPNDPDTGSAKGEGENLAGGQSAATAPSQWFAEKSEFDAAPNKSGFGNSNPDWFNWGHYSQMVWSATTKIGCGTAPGPNFQITSCRYSPPGNFDGQLPYPGADKAQAPATGPAPENGTPPADNAPDNGTPPADNAPDNGPPPADNAPDNGADNAPDNGTPPADNAPDNGAPPADNAPDNGAPPAKDPNGAP